MEYLQYIIIIAVLLVIALAITKSKEKILKSKLINWLIT